MPAGVPRGVEGFEGGVGGVHPRGGPSRDLQLPLPGSHDGESLWWPSTSLPLRTPSTPSASGDDLDLMREAMHLVLQALDRLLVRPFPMGRVHPQRNRSYRMPGWSQDWREDGPMPMAELSSGGLLKRADDTELFPTALGIAAMPAGRDARRVA